MFSWANISGDVHQIAPLLIIWLAASVILLGDVFSSAPVLRAIWQGRKDMNPILAIAGVIAAAATYFTQAQSGDVPIFARALKIDEIASMSGIALLIGALLSVLMAWTYLKNRDLDHGEYYVLLLLSTSGAMLMASANDLIVLFLGLEVLSFALYVMAGFARTEERSEEASIKYFLLGAFASAFLLYGIALVYGATQSTNLDDIVNAVRSGHATPMMLGGVALLLVGLGFKAAVIPFHQWTPDVYEGAPTSVTAFMAGAAKIGAFAAILHVFGALTSLHIYWLPAIRVLAILTMIFGNLLAVTQTNVKRMLAYSSIAHAGYLLVAVAALGHTAAGGVGLVGEYARGGALFYLFAYTFMTLGAFGVLIYLGSRGKDYQTIDDLRGLARYEPMAAYTMMFFMLSLGGIPPTMGFMGKWQIFMAALAGREITLAVVMAVASVIAVFYYLRVVYMMTFEEPTERAPVHNAVRRAAGVSIFLAAAATLVFGIAPSWLLYLTELSR